MTDKVEIKEHYRNGYLFKRLINGIEQELTLDEMGYKAHNVFTIKAKFPPEYFKTIYGITGTN